MFTLNDISEMLKTGALHLFLVNLLTPSHPLSLLPANIISSE